jgi:hypothetical protein
MGDKSTCLTFAHEALIAGTGLYRSYQVVVKDDLLAHDAFVMKLKP